MITLPAKFEAAASIKHVVADFLLELSYDDTTPGTLYFSSQDRKLDTYHYSSGVLDWGTISESLDLSRSSASIADVKIKLANKYPNQSGLLSEELFGGSKKFINQNVSIRHWLVGCSVRGDALIRYTGRLVDIAHDLQTVTLTIEARAPWDRVKCFSDLVAASDAVDGEVLPPDSLGKSKPELYGDFTREYGNESNAALTELTRNDTFSPCIYLGVDDSGNDRWLVADHAVEDITAGTVWGYDEDSGRMVKNSSFTVEQNTSAGCIISHAPDVEFYDYLTSNGATSEVSAVGSYTIDDREYAANKNLAQAAYITVNDSTTGTPNSYSFKVEFSEWANSPVADADISDVRVAVLCLIDPSAFGGGAVLTAVQPLVVYNSGNLGSATVFQADTTSTGSTQAAVAEDIQFNFISPTGAPAGTEVSKAWVYGVFKRVTYTPRKRLQAYFGGKGLEHCRWTGGSAVDAIYPHRVFRDMLKGWSGWDATGIDYVEVNGTDWSGSTIDTDRNWLVRVAGIEKDDLRLCLERIQFEGCFIWLFDESSTGLEARIVYQKQSSSVNATLNGNDLSDVKFSHTPIKSMVSKRVANYNRQAVTGDYSGQNTKTNSNRSDWNFSTEENVIEVNLEHLTDSDDVDDFLDYYDQIDGEPKLIISANVDHPKHWGLQRGDRVEFINLPLDPFGFSDYADREFMIVNTEVTPTRFKIVCREVYKFTAPP